MNFLSAVSMEFLVASGIGWVTACGVYPDAARPQLSGRAWSDADRLRSERVHLRHGTPVECRTSPSSGRRPVHGRSPAAGAGAHGHRDRLRHHRFRHRTGVAQPGTSRAPIMSTAGNRTHERKLHGRVMMQICRQHLAGAARAAARFHGDAAAADRRPAIRCPGCGASRWCRSRWDCCLRLSSRFEADTGALRVYRVGDWPAPFGIVLVIDRLSALMLVMTQVSRCRYCSTPVAAGTVTAGTFTRCSSSSSWA
jgi:hypothetical protein